MSPEPPSGDQARHLADRALSMFGEARASFMDRTTSGDTSLREEVEALLAARGQGGTASGAAERPLSDLELNQQVGPYRLLELLGEGGFGSVYLAEQREPVRRRVALKVIKLGMDTREVIARFEAERQALSMMAHANIARVLDVGATDGGRPYFVMELVRGVPITEYCETQRLSLVERLQLFVPVCHALQHAHQKGIIHRDIKPSNVLVTVESGRPVPKVIDFGIAKATLQDLTDKTLVTLQQQLIGTPAYMSPEQAELTGLDIDTRSDIYALGVLLYELLTGATPFDGRTLLDAGRTEMLRIIREEEPRRPSARVGRSDGDEKGERRRPPEADLIRRLNGDLDWIVMMCLEKDRTRRYETASELAADVQRHMSDEPVLAGAPSAAYRMRKFVRRNRAGVVTGMVVVGLLLLAIAGTTSGLLLAQEERAHAQASAKAEKDARLAAQESAREATLAAEKATLAAKRADTASRRAQLARAESQRRADELEVVIALYQAQLGDVDAELLGLGIRDLILEQVTARSTQVGQTSSSVAAMLERLQDQLAGVNFTSLALETIVTGLLDPTLTAVRETFADQPLPRAKMEQTLGDVLSSLGLWERAESPLRSSLETFRAELGDDGAQSLEALTAWGKLVSQRGDLAAALEIFEQGHEARARVLGEDHRDTLASAFLIANTLREQGRVEEALALHSQVLDERLRLLDPNDAETLDSLAEMGSTLFALRRFDEAQSFDQRALDGRREELGQGHEDTLSSMNNLGQMLLQQGQLNPAFLLLQESFEAARLRFGERHGATLTATMNLASVLREMGRLDEAEAHVERALAIRRSLHGERHRDTLFAVAQLGLLRFEQGRWEEADDLLAQAEKGLRQLLGEDHHEALNAAKLLARQRVRSGQPLAAAPLVTETAHLLRAREGADSGSAQSALDIAEDLMQTMQSEFASLSGTPEERLVWLNAVAGLANVLSHYDVSETFLQAGLSLFGKEGSGVPAWLLDESRSLLGEAAAGLERWGEAQDLLLESHGELQRHLPDEHDREPLIRSARRVARFYEVRDDPESAATWWARVADWKQSLD